MGALIVVVIFSGYALSIGPVAYYNCKMNLGASRYTYLIEPSVDTSKHAYIMQEGMGVGKPHPMVERLYLPLMLFCTYVPYADSAMSSYLKLWDKTFHIEKKA